MQDNPVMEFHTTVNIMRNIGRKKAKSTISQRGSQQTNQLHSNITVHNTVVNGRSSLKNICHPPKCPCSIPSILVILLRKVLSTETFGPDSLIDQCHTLGLYIIVCSCTQLLRPKGTKLDESHTFPFYF